MPDAVYSRGALVALLIGLALWFAVVPLRLRGTVALAAAVLGAGPLVAWAFSQDGLTTDRAPLAARVDAGHEFGALLLLMVALLLAAGLAVQFAAAQRADPHQRRLAGRAALAVLALVPVFALIALAAAPGGVDGQVSKAWNQLTDPNAKTPANTPDRLTATSSVRAPLLERSARHPRDRAAAGHRRGRLRDRPHAVPRRHAGRAAHGYVVQTLADLGWAGLAVSLIAAAAWLLAALRATGLTRRDRGLPYDAERIGMLTLASWSSSSACTRPSTGPGSSPPTPASRCCAPAGWPGAALRARLEAPDGPPGPPARHGRTRAGSRGWASACRRCGRSR